MALSGKIEKIIYFPKASKRNRQKLHIDFDQARFRRFNQEKPANRVALQTSDVQARFKTANTAPQAATARKNLGRAVKG